MKKIHREVYMMSGGDECLEDNMGGRGRGGEMGSAWSGKAQERAKVVS